MNTFQAILTDGVTITLDKPYKPDMDIGLDAHDTDSMIQWFNLQIFTEEGRLPKQSFILASELQKDMTI